MFYNNMYETTSKLNEIVILNRQLRNFLSMKGGGRANIMNLKEKLNEHTIYIIVLFVTTFVSIIYFCTRITTKNNKGFMEGGSNINDNISDLTDSFKDKFYETIDFILEYINDIHDNILETTKEKGGPIIDQANNILSVIYSFKYNLLWTMPIPPCFPPFLPLIIIIMILIYVCSTFILDRKLYLPCWGCSEGTIFFKCMPGTGKGSISCTIYTELLDKIKLIISQFKYIGDLIVEFKNAINTAINSILYLVDNITKWIGEAFNQSIGKIFDLLKFLKHIDIPDNWGFNLGEFLLCPDFSTKGNDCIYNKNGSLRSDHGNNPLFRVFWKMIRIILEVPPNIPKFPFGGGAIKKLRLSKIKQSTIKQPSTDKYDVDTTVKASSKNKVSPDKKDIVYENLLKVLIKIDINPIKWLAALFNLIVDAINLVIDQILNVFKEILKFIFSLIVECAKILTDALGKIFSQLLRPLDEVSKIAMKLPKQIYKCIKGIFDIGFFTLIVHYFYILLTNLFPFLKYMKSFVLMLTLIILILSILIFCPMIGAYIAFFKPYNYSRETINYVFSQFMYIIKNYSDAGTYFMNFIKEQGIAKEINVYLSDMKTSYKYVSIVIIVLLIIFIILNMFTNVNRLFLKFVKDIMYDRYSNKFNTIIKKYKYYKMKQLEYDEGEKEDEKNDKNETNTFLNKINSIKNLDINQLKKYT